MSFGAQWPGKTYSGCFFAVQREFRLPSPPYSGPFTSFFSSVEK